MFAALQRPVDLELLLVRVRNVDKSGGLLQVVEPQRLDLNLQRLHEVSVRTFELSLKLQHAADIIQAASHIGASRKIREFVQADVQGKDVVSKCLRHIFSVSHGVTHAVVPVRAI